MDIYKAKIQYDGSLDKLMLIIVVRGDPQNKDWIGYNWLQTASKKTLKYYLSDSAKYKVRVHQLDFMGSFLQAKLKNRVFLNMEIRYADNFQTIIAILEEPWDYWNLCIEWLSLEIYLQVIWRFFLSMNYYSNNINARCLFITSMHQMERKLLFHLMLIFFLLVSILNSCKIVCGHYIWQIPCEIPGICTLVYINHYFTAQGPFHFNISG